MRKIDKRMLKIVEKIARNEVIKNINSTFPFCNGIFHQPKRPIKEKEIVKSCEKI